MKEKIIILIIILILIGAGVYLSHLYFKKTPERLERTIENRVINGMNQIQNLAKAIYEENKDYSKASCLHPKLTSICKELDLWLGKEPLIHSSSEAYCSYTGLHPGEYYCIDSTGFAGKVTTNPSKVGYCDGITFVCKEEEIKDETADWKTYKNEEYGFEIKYPPNLFLVESPWLTTTGIEFIEDQWRGKKVHYSFIGIEFIQTPLTPQEWTEKNGIKNTETLTIGSFSVLQFYSAGVSGGGTHTLIQYSKANILVDIENHVGPAGEGKKIPDDIYNQMLSTFRFLE